MSIQSETVSKRKFDDKKYRYEHGFDCAVLVLPHCHSKYIWNLTGNATFICLKIYVQYSFMYVSSERRIIQTIHTDLENNSFKYT